MCFKLVCSVWEDANCSNIHLGTCLLPEMDFRRCKMEFRLINRSSLKILRHFSVMLKRSSFVQHQKMTNYFCTTLSCKAVEHDWFLSVHSPFILLNTKIVLEHIFSTAFKIHRHQFILLCKLEKKIIIPANAVWCTW